jgi:hypothetical protein
MYRNLCAGASISLFLVGGGQYVLAKGDGLCSE